MGQDAQTEWGTSLAQSQHPGPFKQPSCQSTSGPEPLPRESAPVLGCDFTDLTGPPMYKLMPRCSRKAYNKGSLGLYFHFSKKKKLLLCPQF